MCGIAGVQGEDAASCLEIMLDALSHRGPDGRRSHPVKLGGLGHVRLAIMDPEGGAQPLHNEDKTLTLIANGEIYNHRSVRARLSGHTFQTTSDSEVILHLYEEKGPGMLETLRGMYAIAILHSDGTLFLARDPLGIKPLYWGKDERGRLLFASEMKALLPLTKDVRPFPPGHFYRTGEGVRRFFRLNWKHPVLQDPEQAVSLTRSRLEEAVRACLVSDVEVGSFLSGGLDSSLVTAMARRIGGPGLKTFAVGMPGSPDLAQARKVATFLGTDHKELIYTQEDVLSALPDVIRHLESFDVPLVRSAVATHFASLLASRHVKVVLTGEGADELFAGYHYLKDLSPESLQRELRAITLSLHRSNLQRADRLSMAHGVEARVPFLELPVVALAFATHPGLKLGPDGRTEKWILRRVAEAYLPADVVSRPKEKFSLGTGSGQFLGSYAEKTVSASELKREEALPGGTHLVSLEELLYWRYFRDLCDAPSVLKRMGRARTLGNYDLNPGAISEEAM